MGRRETRRSAVDAFDPAVAQVEAGVLGNVEHQGFLAGQLGEEAAEDAA
jgi:hypothetical protein